MSSLSLDKLFGLMVSRGSKVAARKIQHSGTETSTLIPMSVRVSPRTRAYFEAQAEACGAPSPSAMVAMVLEGVMAATEEPIRELTSTELVRKHVELVRERFLHLFRIHGFNPHMIAATLAPHGIGLAEIEDDTKLLPLLTEEVIEEQSRRFGVSLEWLNGETNRPIKNVGDYHKNPKYLCRRVVERLMAPENPSNVTVLFLRERGGAAGLQQAFEENHTGPTGVGIVLRETHRTHNGKEFHRYDTWREVPWGYDQSRLSVKAIILWLERLKRVSYRNARFEGLEVDDQTLDAVCSGNIIPAERLEQKGPRDYLPRWDPEDYVGSPGRDMAVKETSEYATAVKYYKFWDLDKEFLPLGSLFNSALNSEIDAGQKASNVADC